MSDLISRQAAVDAMAELQGRASTKAELKGISKAWKRIKQLPSAQPEIIRCKDCRWRKDQSGSAAWLPCRAIVTPSDFYCCRAERRGDE